MKNTLYTAAIIASLFVIPDVHSEALEFTEETAQEFLSQKGMYCENIPDVSSSTYGNIKVFHITCKNRVGTSIYDFVPSQLVQTYYVE